MKLDITEVDDTKAEKLIVYICHKMQAHGGFGATVLNKCLYYIDHTYYVKFGKKLTGFKYVKQRFGPTPKPSEFLRIKDKLIASGEVAERSVDCFGKVQKRLVTLNDDVDVTCFSGTEINLVDGIIAKLAGYDGKSISDVTHEELSWKLADLMEELPAYAYLLSESPLTEEDLDWAQKEIREHAASKVH